MPTNSLRDLLVIGVLVELGGFDRLKRAYRLHKIIYSAVDEEPEVTCKSLTELVGANGFEPSTSWSRTRFRLLLKSVKFCGSEAIDYERVGASVWKSIEA